MHKVGHSSHTNNREPSIKLQRTYKVWQQHLHPHEPQLLGYIPSDSPNIVSREGTSYLREVLADRVRNNNLSRPISILTKSTLEQWQLSLMSQLKEEGPMGGFCCRPGSN